MQLQRALTSVAALAIALATPPATVRHQQESPAVASDHALVGLPVFTSDGHSVGMVIAVGADESDEAVLVAQIERPLGFGSDLVAIPMDMFMRKADRIELTITEGELRDRATRSNHKQ
jgi:hypothetical protein